MRNSSEIIGLPILCIKEGITYGQVKEFLINPDEGKIDFIVLDNGFWYSGALIIPYSRIYGIGFDAVTTPSIDDICAFASVIEAQKLVDRGVILKGARIYTVNGQYMGTLSEYAIRVEDGKIVGCTMSTDEGNVFIASDQIMTFGRDVILLRESEQDEDSIETTVDLKDRDQSDISLELENIEERIEIVDALVPDTDIDTEQEVFARTTEEEGEYPTDDSESSNDEVQPNEDSESEENSASILFEQRQRKFLIGRKASKSILDDEGTVLVKVNQEITDELIDIVKIHGRLIELTMNTKL